MQKVSTVWLLGSPHSASLTIFTVWHHLSLSTRGETDIQELVPGATAFEPLYGKTRLHVAIRCGVSKHSLHIET